MPKTESSSAGARPVAAPAASRLNWLVAAGCAVIGLLLAVAFLSYDPAQSTFFTTHPVERNIAGSFGATASWLAFFSLGASSWLIPVFLFRAAYLSARHPRRLGTPLYAAMVVCLASAGALLSMLETLPQSSNTFPRGWGGIIGVGIYQGLFKDMLGDFGTVLLLGAAYLAGLVFIFTKDIGAEFEKIAAAFAAWRESRRAARRGAAAAVPLAARAPERAPAPLVLEPIGPANKNVLVPKTGLKGSIAPKAGDGAEPAPARLVAKPATPPVLNIVKPVEAKKAKATAVPVAGDDYKFPPVPLLKEQVRASASGNSEDEHRQNAENLLRILGEFGVDVNLGEIHVGPVITRYEVVPAPGVRVEKISGLDKNIALGMRAQSVRILAPIPGKAAVGVEVPNQHPTPVGLREVIESEEWASGKFELPMALGKDVSGKPLISDLAKMPHLLIAGATGSGKSVCINAIVASILYSRSPRDVRLIMVDPKVVELKIFNSLPHMLIPVLTEPKKVPAALKWLLREMEKRYQIFAKANVRNIVGFNHRKKDAKPDPAPAQPGLEGMDAIPRDDDLEMPEHLPYIVVIVDELADLMMIAPAEIETNIARLAALARAAGIHLIIATQRPSVNVVTGVIKANLPSRIAFQVASQVDSRTIIDTKGADTLIGRGDMLFMPPGSSRILRAQGAFVADSEVQAIVDFLRENNAPPAYAQDVQQQIDRTAQEESDDGEDGGGEDGELGDDEELFRQAFDVLKSSRRASTSMLQRRLRIGYNRAARVMEIMEEKGIVGPENGSSPREILVDLDAFNP